MADFERLAWPQTCGCRNLRRFAHKTSYCKCFGSTIVWHVLNHRLSSGRLSHVQKVCVQDRFATDGKHRFKRIRCLQCKNNISVGAWLVHTNPSQQNCSDWLRSRNVYVVEDVPVWRAMRPGILALELLAIRPNGIVALPWPSMLTGNAPCPRWVPPPKPMMCWLTNGAAVEDDCPAIVKNKQTHK